MEPEFTHKGWFGICPIYIANLDTEVPILYERHWIFSPLMTFSEMMFGLLMFVMSYVDEDYEPQYPIRITGELKK